MNAARWTRLAILIAVSFALGACSTLGFHKKDKAAGTPPSAAASVPSAEVVPGPMTKEQVASELRTLVTKEIAAASRDDRNTVERRRPYYFKQYAEYPASDEVAIDFQERDSRTTPYSAEVNLPKVRYATRLHRVREEAATDQNFLRDTGNETISFEFRNGRWVRLGSLFHAEKVEENVNGEWLPVREEVKRTVAAEEQNSEGWFGRTWSAITGR